jgi:membrane protease YdiL (CAAX protease family)
VERTNTEIIPPRGALSQEPSHAALPSSVVLATFVLLYAVGAAMLAVSIAGDASLYAPGLFLLVLLSAAVFVGSLRASADALQRFYLVLTIAPGLTIARLTFVSAVPPAFDLLFVYFLLAGTLAVYRQAGAGEPLVVVGDAGKVLRGLPSAGIVAVALAILALQLPRAGVPAGVGPAWIGVTVAAPVAFLDELWFRGVLQQRLQAVTSRRTSWLATALLFVAYGEPFGTVTSLAFRMVVGLVLGAIAARPGNLPLVLVARTLMAVAIALVIPGSIETSLIV